MAYNGPLCTYSVNFDTGFGYDRMQLKKELEEFAAAVKKAGEPMSFDLYVLLNTPEEAYGEGVTEDRSELYHAESQYGKKSL